MKKSMFRLAMVMVMIFALLAGTVCCAIAHRYHKGANTDYKPRVAELVKFSLDRLAR